MYMAPEVLCGDEKSSQYSDMYAFGLMLHEALFGRWQYSSNGTIVVPTSASDSSDKRNCADLINKLLRNDPRERLTANLALSHPFFSMDSAQHLQVFISVVVISS